MPKHVASQMVNDFFKGEFKDIQTNYDGNYFSSGESIRDQANTALRGFSNEMSPALKRMKVDYLNRVTSECYQPQHISDDFTNEE